jgi:hypothetical protein
LVHIEFLKLMRMDLWNYKILKEKFIPQGIMGIILNFMQLENKLKLKRGGVMKNKCESKIKIYGKRNFLN